MARMAHWETGGMSKQLLHRNLIFFVGSKFRNNIGDLLIFSKFAFEEVVMRQPR